VTYQTLTTRGILSDTDEVDVNRLAAAIYARGWSYSVDRAGSDFRATIDKRDQTHAVGAGWSVEAAMAFALEKASQTR
jgi:hypothetical protein